MYLKEIKIEKEEETQQGDFETLGVSGKRRPSSPSPERPGEWPGDVFPPLFNEELANLVAGFWQVVSTHAEAVLLSILKQFLKRCLWILKAMLVDMYARAWPPSASGAPGLSAPGHSARNVRAPGTSHAVPQSYATFVTALTL